ncbi:nucleoid occlusion factor SlmA [Acidiferrobacter sp.]|jgi:TetR/AcrR family transcriptional regulator|uniref:nucleoid occlusion factor SlmA n=1 Tax=Acidiferrobacter sp. TaxID=1872107 RepID=UPI0026172AB8|nr:nucleoid occlusion factor SlmA [Acidiferrobacter sp.]
MARPRRGERRQEILETLARLLEETSGTPITTARLASAVGVSEAALYRHFPSKARMFEALFEFIEESLFTRINRIGAEPVATSVKVGQILHLWLAFADKNHGLANLLQGAVLAGEHERLRDRLAQLYERLETHLRALLRDAGLPPGLPAPSVCARLLLATADGRVAQAVRTRFRISPLAEWDAQWAVLRAALFAHEPAS